MKNKGFTLIELLVVVAIIGILAAVGVVAYNGYTASAKIASVKSNHSSIVKFLSSELKKCEIGETEVMVKDSNKLTCSSRKTSGEVAKATNNALGSEFKNPYSTSNSAIKTTKLTSCGTGDEGYTSVTDNGTKVEIISCEVSGATLLSGSVTIE